MFDKVRAKTFWVITQHCQAVGETINHICNHLHNRAINHDKSKYKDDEFEGFCYFNTLDPNLEYGSKKHKEAIERIKPYTENTLKLHYSRNSHHPEFHDNLEDMTLLDLIEMVCDWKSASIVYHNQENVEESKKAFEHSIKICKEKYNFTETQLWIIDQVAELLTTETKS